MSNIWFNCMTVSPEPGAIICVIRDYHKKHGYMSVEIFTGEVEFANDRNSWRIVTNDCTGKGGWGLFPIKHLPNFYCEDTFTYWAYATDMPELPKELYGDEPRTK